MSLRERQTKPDSDLPEDPDRGVALACLDLRQRRAADAGRTREESSSDSPLPLRRWRRLSATRRPSSAARASSPLPALGRFDLRIVLAYSTITDVKSGIYENDGEGEEGRRRGPLAHGPLGRGEVHLAEAILPGSARSASEWSLLDGDAVRTHLSKGLGFSREDRDTNIARIAFVAHLLARNGVSSSWRPSAPSARPGTEARATIGDFVEIHVAPPLEECIRRDVKGLYAKAIAGEIQQFTGISDPYEEPLEPELRIDTSKGSIDDGAAKIIAKLRELGYLDHGEAAESTGV